MKKSILSVMAILIATFGMITKVKANTINIIPLRISDNTTQIETLTTTITNTGRTINQFDLIPQTYTNRQVLYGQSYYALLKTNGTYTSNIDYDLTCGTSIQGDHAETGTITYADGTTATISYNEYVAVCTQWIQNNTYEVGNYEYEPDVVSVAIAFYINNEWFACEVNEKGFFKCNIPDNGTISKIRFFHNGTKYSSTNLRYGLFMNYGYLMTSDTANIIANENSNWNNFNSQDISSQSKTPIDTSTSDSVNQKETQIYDVIKQSPSELDILSIDLDPNTNNWIWTTINTLIAQHRYLTILFVSIMTIGVAKLIFGR